jgi:hypothetical protein
MIEQTTSASCRLCGRTFSKRQMTNHLKRCWEEHAVPARGKKAQRWFHLVVEGRYGPDYWVHLQAPANRSFGGLDSVLRRLWLECCGHLSAFEFPVKRPRLKGIGVGPLEMLSYAQFLEDERTGDEIMGEPLGKRLQTGMVFEHQYDFGTTTHLKLKVAGEHQAPAMKGEFKVLARNEAPDYRCDLCGKPATQICTECICEGEGNLCDACASKHKCGEEMLLPLVNSPRTGQCGYCGPSDEP